MTLLRVEGLSRHFGGIRAIDDVSFVINPGTIHSIIGPNGAGKTTLLNLLTGVYRPTAGRILLNDRPIQDVPAHTLAGRGLARTFQNLQIFTNMTALENVMVGRHRHMDHRLLPSLLRLPSMVRAERACAELCAELITFVGCGGYLHTEAAAMPYGALKRLEIARALAAEPQLLMLDEPAAGLNASETAEIDEVIRKIAAKGITVALVEHDMKMVMGISDHVLVLDHGRTLAEGTPAQVCAHQAVIAAYLGTA
ncbi:MAG: High-affinity branched-chain amino acid transport protein superfamily, ATP-binding [Pseudomonadota bacterium]|jgi:branched-chain amino acid transport system ATP-binding protein